MFYSGIQSFLEHGKKIVVRKVICEFTFMYHCEYAFTILLGISVWRRQPVPVPRGSVCWGREEDGGGGHSWSCTSLWERGSETARQPAGQSLIRIILTSKNWWYILSHGTLTLFCCLVCLCETLTVCDDTAGLAISGHLPGRERARVCCYQRPPQVRSVTSALLCTSIKFSWLWQIWFIKILLPPF